MSGTASVPNTFAGQAGLVPASQLDANWTAVTAYINTREVSSGTLAARPTAPSGGTWYFATDDNGGTLYFAASTGWVKAAQGVSGSGTLTAPLTLSDSTAGGIEHPFLDYQKVGTETWRTYFDRPTIFGSSATLMFTPLSASPSLLRLAFAAMDGGMRLYLWDTTTALANHPHTNTPPAFAVHGDITVGDIATFSPRGNAWGLGIRTASDLDPSTDIATFYSARNTAGVEPDAGANLTLSPMKNGGGAVSDGVVQLIAYGGGTGSQANEIQFKRRSGSNTVVSSWHIGGAGSLYPFVDGTVDIGVAAGNRVRAIYSSAVYVQVGTTTSTSLVGGTLRQDAAGGTGSPGDTNENTLKASTLPGAALVTDGDLLHFISTFRCAANNTTKRIRVYFGATTLIDSTALALNNTRITVEGWIARTGAASQVGHTEARCQADAAAWNSNTFGGMQLSGPAENLAGQVLLRNTVQLGAGAALNDVIQDLFIVEYRRVT